MDWYLKSSKPPDRQCHQQATQRQQSLTKPPGSLGQLETLAVELAAMQNRPQPAVERVEIAVFAGDHGVAQEGVSAFPQAVTVEMVRNFIRGGAAISVMAKQLGAGLTVVNAGTLAAQAFASPVVNRPVARGTHNFVRRAAMSRQQAEQALALGKSVVDGYADATELVIGGEMGIGNTTSATALTAVLTGREAGALAGPGTGLDTTGLAHKRQIIQTAIERAGVKLDRPESVVELLAELGGFEIAALTGYYIAAGQAGRPILVDGFIASAAALLACRLNPSVRPWMLFAHTSAEPGHAALLAALAARPLLDLGLRLGEGSGAAIAVTLLRSACALHNQMATFEQAGVSSQPI